MGKMIMVQRGDALLVVPEDTKLMEGDAVHAASFSCRPHTRTAIWK